jgi:TolB protein
MTNRHWTFFSTGLSLCVLLVACRSTSISPPSPALNESTASTPVPADEAIISTGKIAYSGEDNNIYIYSPENSETLQVTTNGNASRRYSKPTWTRDGSKLSFYMETAAQSTVFVYILAEERLVEIYSSRTANLVYSHWSPDNEHLGFIASAGSDGFAFRYGDYQGDMLVELDHGVPYFWDYAPDGQSMVNHAGGQSENNLGRIMMLPLATDEAPHLISDQPGRFFAPDWSLNGERIVVAVETRPGDFEIQVLDAAGDELHAFKVGRALVAFALSPDGSRLAVLQSSDASEGLLSGDLAVFDLDSNTKIDAVEGQSIVAFFWAPDSEQIAYFVSRLSTTNEQTGEIAGKAAIPAQPAQHELIRMTISVLRVGEFESTEVTSGFGLSEELFSVIYFFDQYQRSDTIWSPDSRALVLSGQPQLEQSGIWLFDIQTLEKEWIGAGDLAFWSER